MNLGWKLAAAVHGRAPEGLLDSYHEERHLIGANVLEWSRAQVAIMKPCPHARALRSVITDLINTKNGATYMASRISGVNLHYNLGDAHPLIGYSAPDFELEDGTKIHSQMRDAQTILLDFRGCDTLKNLENEYGQMRYVFSHAKDELGLGALLIRPDGFVAWACNGEPDEQEVRKA
ncbi:monoogygenase, partial [Acrasis kona]